MKNKQEKKKKDNCKAFCVTRKRKKDCKTKDVSKVDFIYNQTFDKMLTEKFKIELKDSFRKPSTEKA